MLSVLGFLVILCPLVVVHELGHFLFAKLFNVKAEAFSIGFGPRLWKRQIGETEWRVSAIPLGGYVKLLGEEPGVELSPEDQKRSLAKAAPWKRFFIFFGGPLFNFLFAIFVFMVILVIGEPQLDRVIGRVVHDSAAERAGFRSGDRILSINDTVMKRYEDVRLYLSENPNTSLDFKIERSGQSSPIAIQIDSTTEDGYTMYGEFKSLGTVDGLMVEARANFVGVSNPGSPAARAGFRTGDKIEEFNGRPVKSWEELELLYQGVKPASELVFKVSRVDQTSYTATLQATKSLKTLADDYGLYSSELFIDKVIEKSPAETAGLKSGDRLITVGNQVVQSFSALRNAVQKSGESDGKVQVTWERDGKLYNESIVPNATSMRDPTLKKKTQYTIGVMPQLEYADPVLVIERVFNPFVLLYRGADKMVTLTWRNFVSIKKMFAGDVSVGTLGGPVLIGKLAGESLTRGLIAFLSLMAMLSVGLGVLNILPVPVLDGGHLMLLSLEMVRRKPLTIRQMEIAQGVGLSLILLLMVVVIRNDLSRLPIFN